MSDSVSKAALEEVPCGELTAVCCDIYVRELAFWGCVNMIAGAVSKCEFKTYRDSKETRKQEWYLWNVEPNKNQGSGVFLRQLIGRLYRYNEALVIGTEDGKLLVADDYSKTEYAVYEDIFEGVTVKDYTFSRSFRQGEVLYFRLAPENMRAVINGLYNSYAKLIAYGIKSYQKSRGQKGIISVDTMGLNDANFQKEYERLKNGQFQSFFDAENAVMPLYKGFAYTDIGSKTYSNETSRDIRAMIDDVAAFTARGFGIHPALVSGDVAGIDDALEQTLTFCLDPLLRMLETEINRKRYGYKEMEKGNYLRIDAKAVRHVDLLSVSGAVDKLISSGAFCINDIRKLAGEPPIEEPWAYQHFMTKNYSPAGEILNSMGEEGEKT